MRTFLDRSTTQHCIFVRRATPPIASHRIVFARQNKNPTEEAHCPKIHSSNAPTPTYTIMSIQIKEKETKKGWPLLCGGTKVEQAEGPYTLILIRHGESEWNIANKFTGWHDCPLSPEGVEEVIEAGKLIKAEGFEMDVAFTSMLKRAISTLNHVLEQNDRLWIPVTKAWQLNERHYGGLTGLDKLKTVEKHGEEQVLIWRRSYDIPPPTAKRDSEYHPGNDPRYSNLIFPDEFTETLATTLERVVPYFLSTIVPELKSGKTVVVAAHGNSLRALVKHLDGIDKKTIPNLNIPTGVPLVYQLDENMDVIPSDEAMAPLRGRYLGDQDEIKARIEGVQNQTKH